MHRRLSSRPYYGIFWEAVRDSFAHSASALHRSMNSLFIIYLYVCVFDTNISVGTYLAFGLSLGLNHFVVSLFSLRAYLYGVHYKPSGLFICYA